MGSRAIDVSKHVREVAPIIDLPNKILKILGYFCPTSRPPPLITTVLITKRQIPLTYSAKKGDNDSDTTFMQVCMTTSVIFPITA